MYNTTYTKHLNELSSKIASYSVRAGNISGKVAALCAEFNEGKDYKVVQPTEDGLHIIFTEYASKDIKATIRDRYDQIIDQAEPTDVERQALNQINEYQNKYRIIPFVNPALRAY